MAALSFVSRTFRRGLSSMPHSPQAMKEAGKTAHMWERMFYFVAVPALVLAHVQVYLRNKDEKWERPEFVPYSCVRIRTKPFPWGDGTRTLFHNPHHNALPTGWEEVDE